MKGGLAGPGQRTDGHTKHAHAHFATSRVTWPRARLASPRLVGGITFGMVAEKSAVCLLSPMRRMISVSCCAKPISKSRSASSNTQ